MSLLPSKIHFAQRIVEKLEVSARDNFKQANYSASLRQYKYLNWVTLYRTPEHLLKLAHCYYQTNQWGKAKNLYQKVISLGQGNRTIYLRLGHICYDLFDYVEATVAYRKGLELCRTEDQDTFKTSIEEVECAALYSSQQLAACPKPMLVKKTLPIRAKTRALLLRRKYLEACRNFEKLEKILNLRPFEALLCARTYYKVNDFRKSQEWLDRAKARGVPKEKYQDLQISIGIRKDLFEEVETDLLESLSDDPLADISANIRLANGYFSQRSLDKAYRHFSLVFEQTDYSKDSERLRYAKTLRELGKVEQAKNNFAAVSTSLTGIGGVSPNLYSSPSPLKLIREQLWQRPSISERSGPKVSMVVTTMRPHLLEQVYQNFVRQTYENKEMIIILNRADFSTSRRYSSLFEHPQIKVCFGDDSKSHGALFDQGVRLAKGELIAKIDDDDLYGPRYLSESVTSLSVSGTRITGKGARFVYIEESNELYLRCPELANSPSVRNISGSSIVAEKSLITSFGWPDLPYGVDTEFLRRILKAGEKVSSANIFSYMVLRQKSQELHTGKTNNLDIRLSSAFIAHGQHKKLILDGIFTTESLA